MILRLIAGASAWLLLLALFAAALPWYASPPSDAQRAWTIVKRTTVRDVLIVEVDALRLSDAAAIAAAIVEPLRTARAYGEILVYVKKRGAGPGMRRLQWTPQRGYVELIIDR